jgi:hypothetical protein
MSDDVAGTRSVSLLGRVVVVAGADARLAAVAAAATAAQAQVAVVSTALAPSTDATVRFNADPCDPDAWERIAVHVEQHLGPVDGVVTDDAGRPAVEAVFAVDLARRGRPAVVVVRPDDDVEAVVTRLRDTPPARPSRPRADAPRR